MSLVFTLIAIAAASNAGSRLFGRWAARSTTLILALVFWLTGVATSADPTPLAMAGLGISLLAIAIVENTNRRSFILLAGLAATVAAIASYSAIVFVLVLTWFFTLLRGRKGPVSYTHLTLPTILLV